MTPGIEPKLAACEANGLPSVLFLQLLSYILDKEVGIENMTENEDGFQKK